MQMTTATSGPGPSSAAFRARVQAQARDAVVPGHFPPAASASRDIIIQEIQPPMEVIFVLGIAGYLLSLFYMLPCASYYIPLPRRRPVPRPAIIVAPPFVRHVTFTPSPTPSLSADTSPETISLSLPSPSSTIETGRRRGLSFGLRRRVSKDKEAIPSQLQVDASPPISPRSSISFSRSASPELGAGVEKKSHKLRDRCSKILHLPSGGADRPQNERRASYPWRRSTSSSTTGTVVTTDEDEEETQLPSFGTALATKPSTGSGFLAGLRKSPRPARSNSLDVSICPISAVKKKEKDEAKGRTNPYVFMGSDAALPDYERRRREREKSAE